MKINKQELQQLIKEEIENLLLEQVDQDPGGVEEDKLFGQAYKTTQRLLQLTYTSPRGMRDRDVQHSKKQLEAIISLFKTMHFFRGMGGR